MQMNPYSGKTWQDEALGRSKTPYPMRFVSAEAALSFWNDGKLEGVVWPFLWDGANKRLNPDYQSQSTAPVEFRMIKT